METAKEKEKGKCSCNSVCQTGLSQLIHINLEHCFSPQLNLFGINSLLSSHLPYDHFHVYEHLSPVVL